MSTICTQRNIWISYSCSRVFQRRLAFANITVPPAFRSFSGQPTTTFELSGYKMVAPMIELVWQSSNRVVAPTSTNTLTPAPATSTADHHSTTHHAGTGLSTGMKAVIGVAIPAIILAAALAIFVLYQRHVRRLQQPSPPSSFSN